MHAKSIYCTTAMHRQQQEQKKSDRQTGGEGDRQGERQGGRVKRGGCQTVPEKEHPRVREGRRKRDERGELGEDRRMRNG